MPHRRVQPVDPTARRASASTRAMRESPPNRGTTFWNRQIPMLRRRDRSSVPAVRPRKLRWPQPLSARIWLDLQLKHRITRLGGYHAHPATRSRQPNARRINAVPAKSQLAVSGNRCLPKMALRSCVRAECAGVLKPLYRRFRRRSNILPPVTGIGRNALE